MQDKLVEIRNTRFDAPPGSSLSAITMGRANSNGIECLNKLDEVRVYAYNGIATDNFQVYHTNTSVLPRPPGSCTPTTRAGISNGVTCPIAPLGDRDASASDRERPERGWADAGGRDERNHGGGADGRDGDHGGERHGRRGRVISEIPAAGTSVAAGSAVNFVISAGQNIANLRQSPTSMATAERTSTCIGRRPASGSTCSRIPITPRSACSSGDCRATSLCPMTTMATAPPISPSSTCHRHLVHPPVEHELHDLRDVPVGPAGGRSRAGRLRW